MGTIDMIIIPINNACAFFVSIPANKLDCFGLAYTTVAACQVLNVSDVRLCLSEDHAWIMYVDAVTGREETAEVTWHGKTPKQDIV